MSDKLKAAEAMVRYGGSFASALAKAWFAADAVNRATLEGAFRELFVEYAALADRAAAEPSMNHGSDHDGRDALRDAGRGHLVRS